MSTRSVKAMVIPPTSSADSTSYVSNSTYCTDTMTFPTENGQDIPLLDEVSLGQYTIICHECKMRPTDEEGRTHIPFPQAQKLGLTFETLWSLTKQGFIRWGLNGEKDMDVKIVFPVALSQQFFS